MGGEKKRKEKREGIHGKRGRGRRKMEKEGILGVVKEIK